MTKGLPVTGADIREAYTGRVTGGRNSERAGSEAVATLFGGVKVVDVSSIRRCGTKKRKVLYGSPRGEEDKM